MNTSVQGLQDRPATLDDAVASLALHVQTLTLGDVAAAVQRGTLVVDVPLAAGALSVRATISTLPVPRLFRSSDRWE